MKILLSLFFSLSLVVVGCGDKSSTPAQTTNAPAASGGVITAPVDYLGALGKAKQTAEKTVDTAAINQAIQLFQVDKGRNPKDLDELVSEGFLPMIPAPPFGSKIVYDANAGVVKVVKQ